MITLQDAVWVRRLTVLLVFLGLAGCGVWPPDSRSASPSPSPSASPLPPDQLVFLVQGGVGGFTPYFHQAMITPSLAVYGDGRVIQHADREQAPDVPAAYVLSRVSPQLVATFAAETEARNLITAETDFGDPAVTDMPSTTVHFHGAGSLHRISVYAFGKGFDDDLTASERRARQELAEVIRRGSTLPGDSRRLPYSPDRVQVTEFAPERAGNTPAAKWPGPDPGSFLKRVAPRSARSACGELSGKAAKTAYAAARQNPGGIWAYAGKRRAFAVVPVLPGLEACPG